MSFPGMIQHDDLDFDDLMKTLTDNFNLLADEVQLLSDRKIILEHKLSFAREQYQHLADKYAPTSDEIGSTLAALQLPADPRLQAPERATFVPLPSRQVKGSKQQTAEAIRDGRRAVQRLASIRGWTSPFSKTAGRSISGTANSTMTTPQPDDILLSSHLEQDFTVPGKKSKLQCPFVAMAAPTSQIDDEISLAHPSSQIQERRGSHHSFDAICTAMYTDTQEKTAQSVSGSTAKCPIRYLDQHSPEEVAQYFENHKHEIPRSHEVCVKRYQRNEDDIRKLDAKYGNLVSMIQGLGQKHQPMLPSNNGGDEEGEQVSMDQKSNERLESWAQAITVHDPEQVEPFSPSIDDEEDRESRFDRPLKEVRLGESPSRPWGIRTPFVEVSMTDHVDSVYPESPSAPVFVPSTPKDEKLASKCPFGHGQKTEVPGSKVPSPPDVDVAEPELRPAFLQCPDPAITAANPAPQMIFTGPVFIGYPVDQAISLLQQWQAGAARNGG